LKKYSLTKAILGSSWLSKGVIAGADGSYLKGFSCDPVSSGLLEESFDGPTAEAFYQKVSELMSKLPSFFEGQVLVSRKRCEDDEIPGFTTTLYFFEKVRKAESYSHLQALLAELKITLKPITSESWQELMGGIFGIQSQNNSAPDITWEKDCLKVKDASIRALSLTELPQVTWKGCLQPIYESPCEFTLSLRFTIPDRKKIKRQLETKRRVSHALSISSSLEVKNIESNSVLQSSEETLERILVSKETLFEISFGLILRGTEKETLETSHNLERSVSGVGNAGLYLEGLGSLPVVQCHIPGSKILGVRKLPILSENLAHIFPLLHDYSRANDSSTLRLRSRTDEVSNLALFSSENLNFNSFICGASGSGKSFLMNAILYSTLKDDAKSKLCIFDVGGSYRKIVQSTGGQSVLLSKSQAVSLIASFLNSTPISNNSGFYRTFIETLCGSGSHITHSHRVAIEDLLKSMEGENLKINKIIEEASKRSERYYLDVAHWLKPHCGFDDERGQSDLSEIITTQITAFDFKELDDDPILQRTSILLLSELIWRDLLSGRYSRTLIVFDEVWRFFAQSKTFLEEMYRTLRKYKAGIVSITQNLADYGDDAFAKMIFTNSYTKIFLQNGAAAEILKNTFDLPDSDIERALSVTSKKPKYSEFFALTPQMSQVFRLYPTKEFYELANTENISAKENG
jgi:type IV secretory pathway VirB4 component